MLPVGGFEGELYAEAGNLDRESLISHRRVFGPEHPQILNTMATLALFLAREDCYAEAEKLPRDSLDISRRVLGLENSNTTYDAVGNVATMSSTGAHAVSVTQFEADGILVERTDLTNFLTLVQNAGLLQNVVGITAMT